MKPVHVILGLGSNLDNPAGQLQQAIHSLQALEQTRLLKVSPFYWSRPLLQPGAQSQPDYLNGVVLLETTLSPLSLLKACQAIEDNQGRVREERWGARTLDLDILIYGNQQIHQAELDVPHPGLAERGFVLLPLQDIMGETFIIPGKGRLGELVNQCSMAGLRKQEQD